MCAFLAGVVERRTVGVLADATNGGVDLRHGAPIFFEAMQLAFEP
jgi:hypothetical protein